MPDCFTVAIIEDDDAVRRSTADLLRNAGHKVDLYTGGAEFLASNLPPDLGCILLDMRMPGMDGLAVMRVLKERDDRHPILMLTGHGDVPMAVEAMRLGAVDFHEKPYDHKALLGSITHACNVLVPGPDGQLINKAAQEKIGSLSARQRDVLRGILTGQPNTIIAWELGLSIRTIEAYRALLLTKLGVRGTAEAVRLAIAGGLACD
jgi:two-component system response regulator FixJ